MTDYRRLPSRWRAKCLPFFVNWATLGITLVSVAVILSSTDVQAQIARTSLRDFYPGLPAPPQIDRQSTPALAQQVRLYQTYEGTCILSFPNYDVRFGDSNTGFLQRSAGAPVVMKNSFGMHWDGSGFFLHPAYPYHELTRNRYAMSIVGKDPSITWPFPESAEADRRPTGRYVTPTAAPEFPAVVAHSNHSPVTLGFSPIWPKRIDPAVPATALPPLPKVELDEEGRLHYSPDLPDRSFSATPQAARPMTARR